MRIPPTKKRYDQVGKRPVRHDGVEKVTGVARYGADINLPGMLYAKVLRSPHAHARLRSVDVSALDTNPEVKAVVTSKDMPSPESDVSDRQLRNIREITLAREKVLFAGHGVAAVAAASQHLAEEALDLIDVSYDVLPSVTDIREAIKPDAPTLHDGLDLEDSTGPNVCSHDSHSIGDVDAGFAQADIVIEREFQTTTVHQGYIEPQTATAWWGSDGRVTIWCSSQGHFRIRDEVASILGLPISRVKVVPMEIGGGFGGKLRAYVEPIAALLSRKTGLPVKLTMTRSEVLKATGPTCGSHVKVKMGVGNDGLLTAARADLIYESGAYPGGDAAAQSGVVFTPYHIPNQFGEGFDVVDNKPATEAYRAPGAPMVSLAAESVIDEICEKLSIDPVEFRIMNAASATSRKTNGTRYGDMGLLETLETVKAHPHYSAELIGEDTGRGVAIGFWGNGAGPCSLITSVVADGTVNLTSGTVDIGGVRTVIAQQFAETLGISVNEINPQIGDTDTVGYTGSTSGSSTAFKSGWAAHEAALDVIRQILQRVSVLWDVSPGELRYESGVVKQVNDPERRMSFKEVASILGDTGGPIVGRANLVARGQAAGIAANIVDLSVDRETGKVQVLRFTAFQDSGVAIHPSYVEGQIQGGSVQGIGWALNEEYFMSDSGKLLNDSLLDYRMPTALDLPAIDAVVVEVPNESHPFGARGVGEASIIPPLAAISNAIYDAVGIRMRRLPITPAAIVKELQNNYPAK